ncbi:hypothetical protein Lal_00011528 [Lupinus albus]|nr:hypothetical protein Lal_00011528 [Lupinus albus]
MLLSFFSGLCTRTSTVSQSDMQDKLRLKVIYNLKTKDFTCSTMNIHLHTMTKYTELMDT